MGKIKNWEKYKRKEITYWNKISGLHLKVYKVVPMTGRNNNLRWLVWLSRSKGEKRFATKDEALARAMKYMRENPRG